MDKLSQWIKEAEENALKEMGTYTPKKTGEKNNKGEGIINPLPSQSLTTQKK